MSWHIKASRRRYELRQFSFDWRINHFMSLTAQYIFLNILSLNWVLSYWRLLLLSFVFSLSLHEFGPSLFKLISTCFSFLLYFCLSNISICRPAEERGAGGPLQHPARCWRAAPTPSEVLEGRSNTQRSAGGPLQHPPTLIFNGYRG